MLSSTQRERYSRHLQLPEIGEAGQARLAAARVLVVGAGGLGSPAVMFLAAAGVGTLAVADYDRVDLSNLQRQLLFRTSDIGEDKVTAARAAVDALNPDVRVETIAWAMDGPDLVREVGRADVVVDASDNFETRFEVNAASRATGTPLVSGAAIRMEGQVAVFDPKDPDSPCYRCLFDDTGDPDEPCARVGVFAPVAGITGTIQAAAAVKLVVGLPSGLEGRLMLIDALAMRVRTVRVRRDPACPACRGTPNGAGGDGRGGGAPAR
ncbi:MAG: HesA/MoeB/ThiF family protein [Immundisolibacterales bacterium]|nr:HesA/MoeB/ThiF family protein [Immundisolibacterales bacterium]